ncbi:uncharacterized protein LOC135487490 [Lineus longissimus]|uniref:uncharacterized protein LOC135487490 n=1 Tax=Lineus longissimus TaxID=88925 RepID=UPI00315DB50E
MDRFEMSSSDKTDMAEDELKLALAKFPSHFYIENDEACSAYLTGPRIRNIKDRIEDDKKLYEENTYVRLREHFTCRDANLTLYLDYRENQFSFPERKMKEMIETYPSSKVSLCNLAHFKIVLGEVSATKSILVELRNMTPLERVLADAEIAYAYMKMGPWGHLNCKKLAEKVVNSYDQDYPGLSEIAASDRDLLNELQVEYSLLAASAIERMFAQNEHGDVLKKEECGSPENLMKESAKFLNKVASSKSRGYEAIGLLMLSNTFQRYKKVFPWEERFLTVDDLQLVWPGLTSAVQWLAEAEQAVAKAGIQNVDYRAIEMLGNEYRKSGKKQDLDKAGKYLEAAAEQSKRPAIYHRLGLVYRQKWENKPEQRRVIDKRKPDHNIRDPGNPLLKKAIEHLEKALSFSHRTSVLFQVDLVRLKYSYCEEPISETSCDEIMEMLNGCVKHTNNRGLTTSGDQAYLFMEFALMRKELRGDMEMCGKYLKLSAEQAIKANKYSSAMNELFQLYKKELSPKSERYKTLGIMFKQFEQYERARWNLDKAREMEKNEKKGRGRNAEDPNILEDLIVVLLRLEEFHHARQHMIILKTNDERYLEKPENRKRYMDVSLAVARQFPPDTAATIYQELITELTPNIKANFVVVISSEEKSDEERTQALVCMIRQGLGFNEDTCVLPYENIGLILGDSNTPIRDHIEYFVEKAWCVIVHLTDIVLGLQSLLIDIDNTISCVQKRGGRVIVVNDVNGQDKDWKERTGKMRGCTPWINMKRIIHGSSHAADTNRKVIATDDTLPPESEIEQTRALQEAAGCGDIACRGTDGGKELNRSESEAGTTVDDREHRCGPKGSKEWGMEIITGTDDTMLGGKRRGRRGPVTRGDTNISRQSSSVPTSEEFEVPESEGNDIPATHDSDSDTVRGSNACIDKKSALPVAGDHRWDVKGLELLVCAMLEK